MPDSADRSWDHPAGQCGWTAPRNAGWLAAGLIGPDRQGPPRRGRRSGSTGTEARRKLPAGIERAAPRRHKTEGRTRPSRGH